MFSEITSKIFNVSDQTRYLLNNLKSVSSISLLLDVVIVAILFYWIYLFLRETRAMRILYGLFLLLVLVTIGRLFDLVLLNWILGYATTVLIVAIPVVFQPELRNALEKLGRAQFFSDLTVEKERAGQVINDIIEASFVLSKNKIGGLIILQRRTGLREYIENGSVVDAAVSKELLLSIFFPRSPLHDGAVIIVGDRIEAARCVLPVSTVQISANMGTRHKAGVGITEDSDAVAIIISEESGAVSLAVGGKIERRITEERLKNRLVGLMRQSKNYLSV